MFLKAQKRTCAAPGGGGVSSFSSRCAPKLSNTCIHVQKTLFIKLTVEDENTCVTVNWTENIPAADCVLIINKRQIKSLSALNRRMFVALIRNKEGDILIVKTMLFYLIFDYSIYVVG